MKTYQFVVESNGFKSGDKIYGPLPVMASAEKGYYPESELVNVPGTQCFFQSAVENNPDIWESIGETEIKIPAKEPRTNTN